MPEPPDLWPGGTDGGGLPRWPELPPSPLDLPGGGGAGPGWVPPGPTPPSADRPSRFLDRWAAEREAT